MTADASFYDSVLIATQSGLLGIKEISRLAQPRIQSLIIHLQNELDFCSVCITAAKKVQQNKHKVHKAARSS